MYARDLLNFNKDESNCKIGKLFVYLSPNTATHSHRHSRQVYVIAMFKNVSIRLPR